MSPFSLKDIKEVIINKTNIREFDSTSHTTKLTVKLDLSIDKWATERPNHTKHEEAFIDDL